MTTDSRLTVNGHQVPDALAQVIDAGRWTPPDTDVLVSVFDDQPSDPRFYGRAEMLHQNTLFLRMPLSEADSPEGDNLGIVPSQTVLVGDLGTDMSIALDYRLNPAEPRVLYCAEQGWIAVAPNVSVLLESLGIEAGSPEE
jgi:hypothetical protein